MKVSTELMLFAVVGAIFGCFVMPDTGGKLSVLVMSFIFWVASRICCCIEKTGEKK